MAIVKNSILHDDQNDQDLLLAIPDEYDELLLMTMMCTSASSPQQVQQRQQRFTTTRTTTRAGRTSNSNNRHDQNNDYDPSITTTTGSSSQNQSHLFMERKEPKKVGRIGGKKRKRQQRENELLRMNQTASSILKQNGQDYYPSTSVIKTLQQETSTNKMMSMPNFYEDFPKRRYFVASSSCMNLLCESFQNELYIDDESKFNSTHDYSSGQKKNRSSLTSEDKIWIKKLKKSMMLLDQPHQAPSNGFFDMVQELDQLVYSFICQINNGDNHQETEKEQISSKNVNQLSKKQPNRNILKIDLNDPFKRLVLHTLARFYSLRSWSQPIQDIEFSFQLCSSHPASKSLSSSLNDSSKNSDHNSVEFMKNAKASLHHEWKRIYLVKNSDLSEKKYPKKTFIETVLFS